MKRQLLFAFCALAFLSQQAFSQQSMNMNHESHLMIKKDDIKWGDAPPSLPAGAKAALLSGDPTKPGPFSIRVSFPANYKVPAHTHPKVENVVVLEGTLYMGSGKTLTEEGVTALNAGSFSHIPAESPHFVFTKEACVIHIYSEGPFAITYINPEDDPRNAKQQ